MSRHILLVDEDGHKLTSSPLDTRDQAIGFARELVQRGGLKILRILND